MGGACHQRKLLHYLDVPLFNCFSSSLFWLSKRILPETDELATALGVIRKLVDFTSQRFPQHAPALLEVLEPFGALIAKELG